MADVDLEALKRRSQRARRWGHVRVIEHPEEDATTIYPQPTGVATLHPDELDAIIAALERAQRVETALEVMRPWIRTGGHPPSLPGRVHLNGPIMSAEDSATILAALELGL